MKKTIFLWLTPLFIPLALFVSSRRQSPHTETPEAAMSFLVLSMRNKDLKGIDEVCTKQGKRDLAAYAESPSFRNSELYDFMKARGFVYDSRKNDRWDVWQAWAKTVDGKTSWQRNEKYQRFQNSSGSSSDVVFASQKETAYFIFIQTPFGNWKLDKISVAVVVR